MAGCRGVVVALTTLAVVSLVELLFIIKQQQLLFFFLTTLVPIGDDISKLLPIISILWLKESSVHHPNGFLAASL